MAEATGVGDPRTTTPETDRREKQERIGRVARSTIAAEAKNRLTNPDGSEKPPTTDEEKALKVYETLRTAKGGNFFKDIPKDDGHDLWLPTGMAGEDAQGTQFDFKDEKLRIAGIDGVTDDGMLQIVLEDEHGEVKKDSTGEYLKIPVPKEIVLDAQLASEADIYKGIFTGDEQHLVTAHIDSLPQIGNPPSEDALPSDATLTALENRYPQPTQNETETEVKTPLEQANDLLAKRAAELEEKGKTEKLSDSELKLLFALRAVELTKGGSVGAAFTIDALKMMDGTEQIRESLKDEAADAESTLSQFIRDVAKDKEKVEWQNIANEPGGMGRLLQDNDFMKMLTNERGADVAKLLFGEDLNIDAMKSMLKDAKLPPELEKAIKDGDRAGILKIILLIAAGVIVAPVVVGAGATFATTSGMFNGQH